ncbi:MAG: type II toxin-antitoxin system RelE/ParE family toxin [Eggerthellaceae bacterium]|jgi:mRNA interferase RelE/StbE|nr:type II toxin-antitoxin system RelE/ParE family toxin [Eggerthellaceae bacterium]MDR2715521.1 type II toxin-antitoxin system RelE/ParE family toxin [Coriobacteriaceae bacterium]
MYEIGYSKPAERYFKKIKEKGLLAAYKGAIDALRANPYLGKQKTGDLRGIYGYDVRHSGVNYELAYRIYEEDGLLLVIILAGTRENFYEELKRLIK